MSFTSTLTIAGSPVNRPSNRLVLNSWTLKLDGPSELEFTELAANLPGSWQPEQSVSLTINSVVVFSGWIFSRHPDNAGSGSISIGYHCLSQQYGAYLIPITATDGTGVMAFNLPNRADPNLSGGVCWAGGRGLSLHTVFGINSPSPDEQIGITTGSQDDQPVSGPPRSSRRIRGLYAGAFALESGPR